MGKPVESLLSLKRWHEDEAKNSFAHALKELAAAENDLLLLEEKFESVGKRCECNAGELININEIRKASEYLEHLFNKINYQKKVITEKEVLVESARKSLVEATKEKKIFQKLDERQKEALGKEYRRQEQIGTDEHAVTGHTRKAGNK